MAGTPGYTPTLMRRETRNIPQLVRNQLVRQGETYRKAGAELRQRAPDYLVTLARGSSDNAATYLKYLVEMATGTAVASAGPSLASVYQRRLKLGGAACFAISQSGQSPDLVTYQTMAGRAGALNLALVNTIPSPLAGGADIVLPVGSGEEKAVAATKSFACSLTAIAAIVAEWAEDRALLSGLADLPDCLERALDCDWSALDDTLDDTLGEGRSVFAIGRGPAFAIAQETALKFKETCQLHAQSYSSAEVLHGPIQLAASGLTALVYLGRDETRAGTCDAIVRMAEAGIDVHVADPANATPVVVPRVSYLPCVPAPAPWLDPICQIVSFYVFAEKRAATLGLDPDAPPLLRKVTETV